MSSAQHLIIAARTRLIPIEIFLRGRWVVVEMTDNREAIDRKFMTLQRLSQRYRKNGKSPIQVVVFAAEKSDIGKVSVVGLHNVEAPPKLATVFATDKGVRQSFWKHVAKRLGEAVDPPVMHYDAIAAERLFNDEAARAQERRRRAAPWKRIEYWAAAAAALVLVGFSAAWLAENLGSMRAAPFAERPAVADDADTGPMVTKSDRLSGLSDYFSNDDE